MAFFMTEVFKISLYIKKVIETHALKVNAYAISWEKNY